MGTFELVDAKHLDYDAFTKLQREAYAELLTNLKVSNEYMNPGFFKWKFNPPAGPAKIVLVKERKQIVSTNAMIPIKLRFGKQIIQGWQATDAATLVKSRRKGYSSGCLKTLLKSLKTDEVIYIFPNKTSIGYTYSMDFENKGVIKTWVKNARSSKNISENVIEISKFGKEQDKLAERLADPNKVMISRTADYLNWRYSNHPMYKYSLFVYQEKNEYLGFSVVRDMQAMGQKVAVITELWGLTPEIKKALVDKIEQWTVEKNIKRIILQDSNQSIIKGMGMRFIPAPSFLLPKKQVLIVYRTTGKVSEKVSKNNWWIQFGDWDGV